MVILIVVKFNVKPDWSDRWMEHVRELTEATRMTEMQVD